MLVSALPYKVCGGNTGPTFRTILRLEKKLQVWLALFVCLLFAACSSSGNQFVSTSTTSTLPVTPQPVQPFNCADSGAVFSDGTRQHDSFGAPRCSIHLLAAVDKLQAEDTIPQGSRGVAVIYDYIFEPGDADDMQEIFDAKGLDGKGNYYLTDFSHPRASGSNHAADLRRTYNRFAQLEPGAIASFTLVQGRSGLVITYNSEQMVAAYMQARRVNPLVRRPHYAAPKVIINFSHTGSHAVFQKIAIDLQTHSSDFATPANASLHAPNIVGVGAVGNSNAPWRAGFRKQPNALLA